MKIPPMVLIICAALGVGYASIAAESYSDITPPPPPREEVPFVPIRERGAGRPTKRERRELEKLRGRDD